MNSASNLNANVKEWTAEQVSDWISTIGFSNYKKQFESINGMKLVNLTSEILKHELKISVVGHQLKILNAIYNLKKTSLLSFKNGDYIPNSVFLSQLFDQESARVLHSFLSELNEYVDQLNLLEKEKGLLDSQFRADFISIDYQLNNLKSQYNSLKNELNYYKDLSAKTGHSNQSSFAGKSSRNQSEATVRVYGNRLPGRQNESYKTFKITNSDDCVKLILECLAKYKINNDWKDYMILLMVNEKETICLNPTDKLLDAYFQHLKDHDHPPSFIIQHIRHVNGPVAKPLNLDPGTTLAANLCLTPSNSAIGIYEYEAQSRVELDVHVGVKYSILARDGEWSVVERNGQRGSVPTSCIFEAPGSSKSRPTQQEVFCVHEYNRRSKNELTVYRGDKLRLLERYHHWCLVQHHDMELNDEEAVGLVPFTFLSMASGDNHSRERDNHSKERDNHSRERDNHSRERDNHSRERDNHSRERDNHSPANLEREKSIVQRSKSSKSNRLSRLVVDSPKATSPSSNSLLAQPASSTRQNLRPANEEKSPHLQKSPISPRIPANLQNLSSNTGLSSPDESMKESFKSSVQELEKYLRQWESLLQDRQGDMPGSVKTLKDIRKLMQYVFSPSSPIHHIILKRPLSGMIAFTLDEVCKKNAHRWLQYTNGNLHGMEQKDLDSILYSSIRKNYSSLMKIVNLVLEDSHVASLILKEK